MPEDKLQRAIHRLLDMVVEEVSLVDRAANQHRFLIIKRRDPMEQEPVEIKADTEEAPLASEPECAEGDEALIDLNALPEDEEVIDVPVPSEGASTLQLATEALEALTEAVEVLGSVPVGEAPEQVAALGQELHRTAERLGHLVSTRPVPKAQAGATSPNAGSTIARVRGLLERVTQAIQGAEATSAGTAQAQATTKRTADDVAMRIATGLGRKLDGFAQQLDAIFERVKVQQQRLARLEKRFGLPNSAPTGEQPARPKTACDAEASWPLDLNKNLDRESVDKAISFHDV